MLTPKQYLTYQFIRQYLLSHRRSPSVREIAEGTNLKNSHGVAHRNIQALVEAGLITNEPNKNRSIKLVPETVIKTSLLPIIGHIAAGEPTEPYSAQDVLDVTELLLDENLSVIKINNSSLINHNISPGDYILLHLCDRPPANKQAVFILDDKVIRIGYPNYHADGSVTIESITPSTYRPHEITRQGIYHGIIRMAENREQNDE